MKFNSLNPLKLKQLGSLGLVFIFGCSLFYSCNDDSNTTEFSAIADVFVQKKLVDGVVNYAPYYYLYGNSAMTSAQATTPASETVELESFGILSYTFINEPGASDFSTSTIPIGQYTFTAVHGEDETYNVTDLFTGGDLDLPLIDSVGYNESNTHLYVSWEPVDEADAYNIKLFDLDGNLVFNSATLADDAYEFFLNENTTGWEATPYTDDHFILQVNAFSFDSNSTDQTWIYNLECNSVAETEIVWAL